MKATSWRGAPFFIENYELGESSQANEIRALRAVKRVSSASAVCSSVFFLMAVLQSSTWIVSAHVDTIGKAYVGPGGVFVNSDRLSFFECPDQELVDQGAREWMQYYGVCASGPDAPALWWWTLLFGWCAVSMTSVGPILGYVFRVLIRVEAAMILVGEMCALSSLICFLNWNYVSDLLFEQALVIGPAASSQIYSKEKDTGVMLYGPVQMWLNWPFWCFLVGFFTCFFSSISLMVVAKSGLRDALVRVH
jgi:hypothetical protein